MWDRNAQERTDQRQRVDGPEGERERVSAPLDPYGVWLLMPEEGRQMAHHQRGDAQRRGPDEIRGEVGSRHLRSEIENVECSGCMQQENGPDQVVGQPYEVRQILLEPQRMPEAWIDVQQDLECAAGPLELLPGEGVQVGGDEAGGMERGDEDRAPPTRVEAKRGVKVLGEAGLVPPGAPHGRASERTVTAPHP